MTAPKLSVSTENGRFYEHPSKAERVPSITNIMNQKNKPGLYGWYSKTAAEYAAENWDMLTPLPVAERTQLIRYSPNQPKEASAIGDLVHDWIDRVAKGEGLPASEVVEAPKAAQATMASFMAFMRQPGYTITIHAAEFTVWSDKYGYAGTGDLDMTINGARVLVDTKTGNRVYWESGMQLAALAKADFILDERGNETPLPAFDRYGILHLRPTFFHLIPVQRIDECFDGFLGLKASFDTQVLHADHVLGMAPKVKTSTVPVEGE